MQGRNTVTQVIDTWLADSPDWAGEQAPFPASDVTLYVRGREPVVAPPIPITCAFTYPTTGATIAALTVVTITGTINVPGAVTVNKTKGATTTTLGAANVIGLNWSYSYTLQSGDNGALTFGATATATVGGSTASALSVNVTVVSMAPALWLSGQSNAGNQDGTAGTIDGRVTLNWSSSYPATIVGPGPMTLQPPPSGGHSFEMQCSADMASHYSSSILVGKHWADGTTIGDWQPGPLRAALATALNYFAPQCVSAGITRVEFGWCQGEGNAANVNSGMLSTYEAYTNDLLDYAKGILNGYGLSVHFAILKTNGNLVTGPNPGDISSSGLAYVRAAQDHIAATRTDATAISFDSVNLSGHLHYVGGEGNTCGAIWATSIAARY